MCKSVCPPYSYPLWRPARAGDGEKLAPFLRPEEVRELAASHAGQGPAACLEEFIRLSPESVFMFYPGEPVLLGGVCPGVWLSNRATVWLLTARAVKRIPVFFFKSIRYWLAHWLEQYPVLVNYVDTRYPAALRLVRHLGGAVGQERICLNQIDFVKVTFRRNLWEESSNRTRQKYRLP